MIAACRFFAEQKKLKPGDDFSLDIVRNGEPITVMDVDKDDAVSDGFAAIQSQHGPIDILINNAGVERAGSIEEHSMDDFRATIARHCQELCGSVQEKMGHGL